VVLPEQDVSTLREYARGGALLTLASLLGCGSVEGESPTADACASHTAQCIAADSGADAPGSMMVRSDASKDAEALRDGDASSMLVESGVPVDGNVESGVAVDGGRLVLRTGAFGAVAPAPPLVTGAYRLREGRLELAFPRSCGVALCVTGGLVP
jgi:hypothetical protein